MTDGRETDSQWELTDERWARIAALLPAEPTHARGGRPRQPARLMMEATLYVLVTGCNWKALPHRFGAPSTVYNHFQGWRDADVFRRMTDNGLLSPEMYDEVERRSRRSAGRRRPDDGAPAEDVETDSPTRSRSVATDCREDDMWVTARTYGGVE